MSPIVMLLEERAKNGCTPQATAVKLAQLGGKGLLRGTSCSP
ncbi:MAG: hypothetical protein Q4D37_08640 [Oscillospiraceae bacterium]|nr:hypothetical protein [Oscillospiraceae bacterium]